MSSKDFVQANEVIIKTDRIQGNMVILKESEEASQYFLMFVGDAEITAIAKEKGLVEPKRPLTHDLYLAMLDRAGVCLLYTSDAADDLLCVDLGGRRIIKKKRQTSKGRTKVKQTRATTEA